MSNTYPRETVEFQPVTVTVDAVAVTTGVTFALVADGTRPVTFNTATALGGKIGVMLTGLAPGSWRIYAKVTSAPETPVIDCGVIFIT